jgi:hypothetical protein
MAHTTQKKESPQTGGVSTERFDPLTDTDTNLYHERTCAMDIIPSCAKNFNSSPYTYDQPIWFKWNAGKDPDKATFIKYNPPDGTYETVQIRVFPHDDVPYVTNACPLFISPRHAVADYWTAANGEQKQLVLAMLRDLYPITFHREGVAK